MATEQHKCCRGDIELKIRNTRGEVRGCVTPPGPPVEWHKKGLAGVGGRSRHEKEIFSVTSTTTFMLIYVYGQERALTIGVHRFRALWAFEVDPALLNLYPDVGLQTIDAKQVGTVPQQGEEV